MTLTNRSERITTAAYTGSISNQDYLERAWVHHEWQENDFFLSDVIHQFFDDTHYAEQPEDHLGESLLDDEEVAAVRRMVLALDTLLTATRDHRMTDADYLRALQWPAVHEAAKALHELIVANDAKMDAT